MIRIGSGFDVHQLVTNRKLILGGVTIPFDRGLLGHSDADVLVHAIIDALLGALALGDIGSHFPDTEAQYKNANSLDLLQQVQQFILEQGFEVGNLDCTVLAEHPKLKPHIPQMRHHISEVLGVEINAISIKATTTEQLGFVGREEGIAAQAVVLLNSRT